MYSKKEISLTRHEFWTAFGQYMAPITSAVSDPRPIVRECMRTPGRSAGDAALPQPLKAPDWL